MTSHRIPLSPWKRNYEALMLGGLPGTGPAPLEFYAMTPSIGQEGVVVQVSLSAASWLGNFQRGDEGITGIYGTPSPEHLCVVARGKGYWVPVSHPSQYAVMPLYPIRDVRTIVDPGLLIVADFTQLAAYDADGRRWVTPDLSWDGVQIQRVDAEGIAGMGWDAAHDQQVPFFIDPTTGRVEGGAAPPSSS